MNLNPDIRLPKPLAAYLYIRCRHPLKSMNQIRQLLAAECKKRTAEYFNKKFTQASPKALALAQVIRDTSQFGCARDSIAKLSLRARGRK